MQGLNNAIKMHYFMSENNECKHQTTYYGVINVNVEEKTIGSVDIWRCSICMKMFCEEKQLGIEDLPPGSFVLPSQFVDFTKTRNGSFSKIGDVFHISTADPFCPQMENVILEAAKKTGLKMHTGKSIRLHRGAALLK